MPVFAQDSGQEPTSPTVVTLDNPLRSDISTIGLLILEIVKFLRVVAYAAAPMAIVIAGYFFLASAGDPGKVSTARNIIMWTLIGVLIIATAELLIWIIQATTTV